MLNNDNFGFHSLQDDIYKENNLNETLEVSLFYLVLFLILFLLLMLQDMCLNQNFLRD